MWMRKYSHPHTPSFHDSSLQWYNIFLGYMWQWTLQYGCYCHTLICRVNNCCSSLYLHIAGTTTGSWKILLGSWKVLEFILARQWEPWTVYIDHDGVVSTLTTAGVFREWRLPVVYAVQSRFVQIIAVLDGVSPDISAPQF